MALMIKSSVQILFALELAAILCGCDLFLTHGEEGQPCFKDQGTCKPGLVCESGTCRKLTSDGGLDGGDDGATLDGGDIGDGDAGDPTVTQIYRSVGPGNGAAIEFGSVSDTLEISGMTANFSTPLNPIVGVGDVVQYDSDADSTVDSLAFVLGRTSSTELRLVNASGGQPVGTTPTSTWEIFRAYTSLQSALNCEENASIASALWNFDDAATVRDLVAADNSWNIACYADGVDHQNVTITDWITDGSRHLRIFTPYLLTQAGTSHRHSGKWTTSGAYTLEGQDGELIIFIGPGIHVNIEGLQIYLNNAAGTGGFCIRSQSDSTVWINTNLIRGNGMGGSGIVLINPAATARIYNNIIYEVADSLTGVGISLNSDMTAYVYNNTIYRTRCGIFAGGSEAPGIQLKNNLVVDNEEYDFEDIYWGQESSHNCSQDQSASLKMANGTSGVSASSVFVGLPGRDFHLKPDDTICKDAGLDLSSDPHLPFAFDIDNQSRPAGTGWDIGADEHH